MYKRLQDLCKAKGTNITHLCEEVTGSTGNLSTWKKGYMRSDYLSGAADILDCSVDYLLGRTDNPNSIHQDNNSGNIINGSNGNNSPLTVNGAEQLDEMTAELVKAFRSLPFRDRLDVINMVMEKSSK